MLEYRSKILILLIVSFLFFSCNYKKKKNEERSFIEFSEVVHNFGTIQQGTKAIYKFKFYNAGKVPLKINEVITNCGCTVVKFPRRSIRPKSRGKITISYDTNKIGKFEKPISVISNAINSPVILIIKGEVIPYEEAAARKN